MTWQESILTRLDQTKGNRSTTPWGRDLRPLQMSASRDFIRYIDEAAKKAGVNRFTFIRRATAVAVAHLTGDSVLRLLTYSPRALPFGHQGKRTPGHDTGEGIELFCPHPGCDGQHLRT